KDSEMENKEIAPNDTKDIFRNCGTCSQTFFYLLNREFGHRKENEERAADLLAGGLRHRGFQCGMLWGSALAVGAESFRLYGNSDRAVAAAVRSTQSVMESYKRVTGTHDCREVVHYDLSTVTGMAQLMIEAISKGFTNFRCFNIAEQWTAPALAAARAGLSSRDDMPSTPMRSCASEALKKMGASEEEAVTVAGLAGGMGLSGNACGALAAAIWKGQLDWCREHPGKNPPYFNNGTAKKILKTFMSFTHSELRCRAICGKTFATLEEHTDYIQNGGCATLIHALAGVTDVRAN
ncbi:MAG TPA: C-GCAxxG-C-C family protein, partial [Spirochaetota bacterium]|nr:C-GCAxxG-C-C family protein [Spirochaetota bacterium]